MPFLRLFGRDGRSISSARGSRYFDDGINSRQSDPLLINGDVEDAAGNTWQRDARARPRRVDESRLTHMQRMTISPFEKFRLHKRIPYRFIFCLLVRIRLFHLLLLCLLLLDLRL